VHSRNGQTLTANHEDLFAFKLDKGADFTVGYQMIQMLTTGLGRAFLLNSSIQRPGERVTAEEIRFMALELEDTLGSVYAVLAAEMQLPLVKLILKRLRAGGGLKSLPDDVQPSIVTGMEALGAAHEVAQISLAMQQIGQIFGPEAAAGLIDQRNFALRVLNGLGIDSNGLLKTEEELAQEAQQAQQQALLQQFGNQAVDIVADAAQSGGVPLPAASTAP
jgi:hypothetical protein